LQNVKMERFEIQKQVDANKLIKTN
jgi:hypothetical protein